MKVVIVDYGTGNVKSVQNMLRHIGCQSVISSQVKDVEEADKLLLPGVGSYDYGMSKLRELDLLDVLNDKVINQKTPVLGICLGAQLLTNGSEEGDLPGLGWIDAYTKKFDFSSIDIPLKIPHMGWSDTTFVKSSLINEKLNSTPRFYYAHSYHMNCNDSDDELCRVHYGYDFTSGVERNNIIGLQFHPEKSHKFGMSIFKNFINSTDVE